MSRYHDAVAAWYAELCRGASTTWTAWLAADPEITPGGTGLAASSLQLEVIRRLAAAGELPGFDALAGLVARTPAFGRGIGDVALPWPGGAGFGPPPVAPEDLPAGELLRVAVPALARLGTRLPALPRQSPPVTGRWWRRGVVLTGLPAHVAAMREDLAASGFRDGGRRATRIAVIAPLERALFDLWGQRTGAGSTVGWRRFWEIRSRGRQLPPGVDAPALVARAAHGALPGSVHVVIGTDPATTAAHVSRITGVQVSAPPEVGWAHADLRRRLNRVLATAPTGERQSLGDRVLKLLPPGRTGAPAAPRGYRRWARQGAERLAGEVQELVAAGGYAVHGNLADLVGAPDHGVDPPVQTSADQTLALAVQAIRTAWERSGGGR